jgi:hypothetical protein
MIAGRVAGLCGSVGCESEPSDAGFDASGLRFSIGARKAASCGSGATGPCGADGALQPRGVRWGRVGQGTDRPLDAKRRLAADAADHGSLAQGTARAVFRTRRRFNDEEIIGSDDLRSLLSAARRVAGSRTEPTREHCGQLQRDDKGAVVRPVRRG